MWLENILLHRPKRWLPEKYPNYDELLTAAVEAAVNGPEAPKDLASWRWGAFNAVEIQHPILGKIPLIKRWSAPGRAGAIGQRIYGQGGNPPPRAIGALHRESGGPGSVDAEYRYRPRRKFSEPVLHGSVEGVVRGNNVHASLQRESSGRRRRRTG